VPPGIDGYSTMRRNNPALAGKLPGSVETAGPVSPSGQAGPPSPAPPAEENQCSQAILPMWKPFWTDLFDRLIAQYPGTVHAIFAGHDHNDDLRIIDAGKPNQQFVLIDPPVSPIYGQNPSFRLVTFGANGSLVDQTTWYLTNLASARGIEPGIWKPEYTFTEEWHSPRLDVASLDNVYQQVRKDDDASKRWMTLLDVSSTYRPMPADGPRAMECAITALDPVSYKACFCPAP
jgi:sphingomyelin phosphodiesterase acid-like 3